MASISSGLRDGRQDRRDLLGERGLDLLVRHVLAEAGAPEGVNDPPGDGRAEIGRDQHLLQLIERRVIQLPLGEDGGDAGAELLRGAGQPLLQPREESGERHVSDS